MGAWEICPTCGTVVADADLHTTWHDATDPTPAPEPVDEEIPDGD